MATIPLGNFGQTVVQPGRGQRVFSESAGEITGRATAELGQTMQQIGLQEMQQQTRMGVEAYEREAQTTAARVRITKQNDLDEAADTLAGDIKAGRVPKDKADDEWNTRRASVLDGAFDGLDERYRGKVQAELEGIGQLKGRTVRDAVTLRDQGDTRANIMTLGEEYQRKAVKDRAGAVAEFSALIDAMGPAAGFGPDEIAKQKQGFRENTAFTQATELVGGARDIAGVRKARETLNGEGFADLDPQRRAQIEATLDGRETAYIQRAAAQEQARAARAQAAMNRAQAAFTAAQARTDAGIPDSPEQVTLTTQALAGTPFLETYRALQTQAREVGGFGSQPIAAQQAALDQVNAQIATNGASESLIKRRDSLQRVLESSRRDYGDDALRAGLQRGVIDALPPIDISSVDAATRTIGQRLQAAQVVQTRTGRPVSPLTNDEAQQFGQMLEALPIQQRATALVAVGKAIGQKAVAGLSAQLSTNGQPLGSLMRLVDGETNAARPTLEIALKGAQAIKEKTIKGWDTTEGDVRADIAAVMGDGRGFGSDAARRGAAEAAYYIAAGLASENRYSTSPLGFKSTKSAQKAVDLAVGGAVIERNGRKIPIPAGMDEDDFDSRLNRLTPENFKAQVPDGRVMLGGQEVPLDVFVSSVPDAELVAVSNGVYNVVTGNRVATNSKGERIIIKAR